MQYIEEAWLSHLPPYGPLVYMILEGTRFLQDYAPSDNKYQCVSIADLSVRSLSMQWLQYCHQACALYLYHYQ
jgi:hypothetical protein